MARSLPDRRTLLASALAVVAERLFAPPPAAANPAATGAPSVVQAPPGGLLRVGGTGAADALLRRLGEELAMKDIAVRALTGLGSSGGIRAVAEGALDLAVVGRSPKPEEARGLVAVPLLRTPFVLANSHPRPAGLASSDVARLYGAERPSWSDGAPVRLILRPRSDSDTDLLRRFFPGMEEALERARARPDVPVAATDGDNADLAARLPASLTAITLLQLVTERRAGLRALATDGVEPSLAAHESGAYPYAKTLHPVTAAFFGDGQSPAETDATPVGRFRALVGSPAGRALVHELGGVPLAPERAG